MEVWVLDVLQDFHERTKTLTTAAGASDDFDVGVDGEHTFLSSPLVYDFEPVGMAFVCVSERLYVLLGVDRRAVA